MSALVWGGKTCADISPHGFWELKIMRRNLRVVLGSWKPCGDIPEPFSGAERDAEKSPRRFEEPKRARKNLRPFWVVGKDAGSGKITRKLWDQECSHVTARLLFRRRQRRQVLQRPHHRRIREGHLEPDLGGGLSCLKKVGAHLCAMSGMC
jgi:hypothetical protein